MGKIRTRILGLEEVEQKQKEEQKKRAQEKKQTKKKIRAPGLKGGERMVEVEVKEEELKKMEKAKEIIEKPLDTSKKLTSEKEEKKPIKIKIHKRGKNYQKAIKLIDKKKMYKVKEAISLLKKIKYAAFDESVELHLNVDKVGLKGEVELPHPTGKSLKVAIVNEKILRQIEEGKIDFDILITHPSFMPKLVKFAKILGPKGLMPNPKTGTISEKPEEVVKKFIKGVIRWKTEAKFPLIHQMIGKISTDDEKLVENTAFFIKSVGINHIKSAFIKTTMSPALKIDLNSV